MNPIPEQVGVMFFERAGAVDIATDDRADLALTSDRRHTGTISERRAREARGIGFLRELEDRDGVGQCASDRLVDEHGLMRLEDRPRLFEMRPPIDTFQ